MRLLTHASSTPRLVVNEVEVPVDHIVMQEVPVTIEKKTHEVTTVEKHIEIPVDKIVVQEVPEIVHVHVEVISSAVPFPSCRSSHACSSQNENVSLPAWSCALREGPCWRC